jgi:MFS family permease
MDQASAATARHGISLRQANLALAVFLAAYILSFVDRQILGLMVDPIRQDLGLSDLQMGLLQGAAFALLYAIAGIPFGLAADRMSRKTLIIGGVMTWSIATALCGLAGSFAALFLARLFVGVGEATLSPSVHSYLSDAYPAHRLARAMSIYTLGITIGGGVALMVGGSVVAAISRAGTQTVPFLGSMEPWQLVFVAVALPGAFIATLVAVIKEPDRRTGRDGQARQMPSLGTVLQYFWAHRRAFLAIHLSSASFGIYGYGITGWYPTLLIRSHGLTPAEAGFWLGLIYLLCGSLGSLAGGRWSEKLALAGHADANLRMVMLAAATVFAPALAAPLMPNPTLVLAVFAPACFAFHTYFACSTAAVQLASPAQMRGINSALFLLTNALVGLSVGMMAVPLVDRWLFGATGELAYALSLVATMGCAGAFIASRWGLAAYGLLAAELKADQNF